MSLELQMSSKSVSKIVRSELGLTPFRVQKTGTLSENNNLWHVLPWTKFYLKNQVWTVQQDSALACEAKIVPPGCLAKFSRFSTTCKRPATSADRNLLDYSVYRISQSRVRERPQPNLKSLEKILEPGRTQMVAPKAPRRHLACIGSRLTLQDKTPRKPTRKEKKIATAEYFKAYHARKAAEKAEAANKGTSPYVTRGF
ncbi:unnamed protein product [Caenorhabditis nigoni]